jgi:Na+-driven multidrug efflux pump
MIPDYGVFGAAISTSIAFVSMLLFSIILFMRKTGTVWNEWLPDKLDFKR